MEFMFWATRSLHIFAVVVWLGGLCFQSAVLFPVMKVEGMSLHPLSGHLYKRFLPFIWMTLWTMGITGFLLIIFMPWQNEGITINGNLVYTKVILFLPILFVTLRARNLYLLMNFEVNNKEDKLQKERQHIIERNTRLNVLLGIVILLIAVWI